jgi:hypothetical protein
MRSKDGPIALTQTSAPHYTSRYASWLNHSETEAGLFSRERLGNAQGDLPDNRLATRIDVGLHYLSRGAGQSIR